MNNRFAAYGAILSKGSGSGIDLKSIKRLVHRGAGRLFVIDFNGDVMATQATALSEEITAVLSNADPTTDEVLVRIESPGGAAHAYGYAASQLQRLKDRGIPLTVAVDKVAASGGYMMACIGDKIISAPYAIIGSIGVVSEFMNFNDLLGRLGVNYQQYTAGKYKRTVGPLGPITKEAEEKFEGDLERVHTLFKNHVKRFRQNLYMDEVATGEYWHGIDAKDKGLVDHVLTSEDYIMHAISQREVLHIKYTPPRQFGDKLRFSLAKLAKDVVLDLTSYYMNMRF